MAFMGAFFGLCVQPASHRADRKRNILFQFFPLHNFRSSDVVLLFPLGDSGFGGGGGGAGGGETQKGRLTTFLRVWGCHSSAQKDWVAAVYNVLFGASYN
jgi:hypothetical protein